MPNILIDFDPGAKCAVVFLRTGKEPPNQWATITTCANAEQLWAAVQAASREDGYINVEKARKRLREVEFEIAKGKADLEEQIRLFTQQSGDLLYVPVEKIAQTARKRTEGKPLPTNVSLDDLGL